LSDCGPIRFSDQIENASVKVEDAHPIEWIIEQAGLRVAFRGCWAEKSNDLPPPQASAPPRR